LTRKPVNAVYAVLGISKAGYVRALRKWTILYIFVVNGSVPHCFIHFFWGRHVILPCQFGPL